MNSKDLLCQSVPMVVSMGIVDPDGKSWADYNFHAQFKRGVADEVTSLKIRVTSLRLAGKHCQIQKTI